MQSWGVQSRFGVRDTNLEPSKSGVIGILCAAMGIERSDDTSLARLAALRMGVRVDREGILKVDYHTAKNVFKAGGGPTKDTELSNRYYLADALFLVGLEGEELAFLESIHEALCRPVWPLFLGRKAFIPGEPIWMEDGLKGGVDLVTALDPQKFPYLGRQPAPTRLRLILEDQKDGTIVHSDQPLSFAMGNRRFAPRRLSVTFLTTPAAITEVS